MTRELARGRVAGLDGLRGVAASAVLVYHVWAFGAPDGVLPSLGAGYHLITLLPLGVVLFFTLSGFLLYRPFAASLWTGAPLPSLRSYARRRVLRLVPAYWVILAVVVAGGAALVRAGDGSLRLGPLHEQPLALAANAALVQGYSPATVLTGIGPAWTLVVEVAFYSVLPLLALAVARVARSRSPQVRVLLPCAALLVAGLVGKALAAWVVLPSRGLSPGWDDDWHGVVSRSLLGHADLFVPGMLLAVLVVAVPADRLVARRGAALPASAGLGLAAVGASKVGLLPEPLFETAMAVAFALLLAAVVLAEDRWWLVRALDHRAPLAAGLASYSVYLWHEPIVRWLAERGLTSPGVGGFARNVLLVGALTGVLSALTYRLVEVPTLRLGRAPRPLTAPVRRAEVGQLGQPDA
jgi:peptidoglycan/LPS O-acetylase OafA/YrhL